MTVTISIADTDIRFPCEPGEVVLDAAERAGFTLPYSCRKGVCETCRCPLKTGEVTIHPSLARRNAGASILTCVSMPATDVEIAPPSIEKCAPPARMRTSAKIHRIKQLSPRVTELRLRLPIGVRAPFVAGQYVRMLLPDDETRNYSIANPAHRNDEIHLHIGLIEGGLFSDRVLSGLAAGDMLELELPFGMFGWSDERERPAILLATGTGFAPLKAMLDELVRLKSHRPVHLFWGGEGEQDIYDRDAIAGWSRSLPGFRFTEVLANAPDGWDGARGFVQDQVLAQHDDLSGHEVYACGNPRMITQAKDVLVAGRGLDPSAFFADAFVSTHAGPSTGEPDTITSPADMPDADNSIISGEAKVQDLQFIRVEVDGLIATVWLDNPPVNAVTQAMYKEIRHFFSHTQDYLPGVRAIVLTGKGKHFCGGNDLAEFQTMTPENAGERMLHVREAFFAIYDCPVPVIGAINGIAVGTGLAIAASCDLVVASDDAKLGLPEVNVGVMGGAKHASRLVPQNMVRYLHLTGEPLPASEFERFGGILKVVPRDDLLAEARAVAEKIVRHSPVTLRFAKQSLNAIEYRDIKGGYEYEQGLSGELSAFGDAKEAVNAFFERRAPRYTGA